MHEFEQAGYGPGPYVQLYVTESSDCGYTCDNCGQKGLRYKFHLRSGNGTEFGVGSECIKKADPDLWLAIKAETGIPGENVSAVMVKRKAIFDEAQPIRTRLIELGWPGGSGVKLFADIDNIKKKQVKTLEKELARMKVILTSAERSAQYRVRYTGLAAALQEEIRERQAQSEAARSQRYGQLQEEIRSAFNRPGRPYLNDMHMDIALSLVGRGRHANDPDRWSLYALEQCLTALTRGQ